MGVGGKDGSSTCLLTYTESQLGSEGFPDFQNRIRTISKEDGKAE